MSPISRVLRRTFVFGLVLAGVACSKKPAPGPPPAPPPPRIGVALFDEDARLIAALEAAAAEAGVGLEIDAAGGRAAAQTLQLEQLIDARVAAVLLVPSSPDLLHEAVARFEKKAVPLVALGRGDGRVGPWVGVRSATLAAEAGTAAATALRAAGIERPRVVVVESSRWPETTRRIEAVLAPIQQACRSLDLPLRLRECETAAQTEQLLIEGLPRLVTLDLIVAADPATTRGAYDAVQKSALRGKAFVVGVTDDPALAELARAADSRLILIHWKPADLAQSALALATRLARGEKDGAAVEVAAEVVAGPAAGH